MLRSSPPSRGPQQHVKRSYESCSRLRRRALNVRLRNEAAVDGLVPPVAISAAQVSDRKGGARSGDLDDIAQEVFLRLLRYERTEQAEHPQAYLFTIASNVAADGLSGHVHVIRTIPSGWSRCRRKTCPKRTSLGSGRTMRSNARSTHFRHENAMRSSCSSTRDSGMQRSLGEKTQASVHSLMPSKTPSAHISQ